MWTETTASGKTRLCDRYIDPLTGKSRKASITLDDTSRAGKKAGKEALEAKIEELCAVTEADEDITVSELIKTYLEAKEKTVKHTTIKRDRSIMNTIESVLGGGVRARSLSARYISRQLDATGEKNVTKNNYLSHIKRMLRWSYQNDYIRDISYLQKLKLYPDNQKERIEDKYLSSDELKKLLAGMKVTRWRLLTHFLALSGLRIGELLALEDSDVTDSITVNKTADPNDGAISHSAKTDAGNRSVFIQPELAAVVKEICAFVRVDSFRRGFRSTLFFPGVHYDAYRKYLIDNSQAILGHKITPHALRHTHVSLLAENGVPLDVISRRVGHEGSDITRKIYLHITEKQKENDRKLIAAVKMI